MYFSKVVYTATILAGALPSVLGALNLQQIDDILNDLTERFQNANDAASQINVANAELDYNASTVLT